MNKISILESFIHDDELEQILEIIKSATETEWNLFNEELINGSFWNGKRLMIDQSKTILLNTKIQDIWKSTNFTASNKLQRFSNGEDLGPIADSDHANIKEGLIIFLGNQIDNAGIEFLDEGILVPATKNLAVFYDAKLQYKIVSPKGTEPMYFITIFLNND